MWLNGSKEVWGLDGNHIAKYNETIISGGDWNADDFELLEGYKGGYYKRLRRKPQTDKVARGWMRRNRPV